ncbi:hypothetical protein GCM10010510_66030 [Streptomyces anandii JCM 4720]|nr:hypothetical protein GCM10010510_66030 [Streptomyces anandii JCM 4720]
MLAEELAAQGPPRAPSTVWTVCAVTADGALTKVPCGGTSSTVPSARTITHRLRQAEPLDADPDRDPSRRRRLPPGRPRLRRQARLLPRPVPRTARNSSSSTAPIISMLGLYARSGKIDNASGAATSTLNAMSYRLNRP